MNLIVSPKQYPTVREADSLAGAIALLIFHIRRVRMTPAERAAQAEAQARAARGKI